ncbi:MAG: metallophosphoesterase [Betaproteobacteria bacterium]|nr:MAG: metallophosphoesterase [Betaproteobacteria bacterium]
MEKEAVIRTPGVAPADAAHAAAQPKAPVTRKLPLGLILTATTLIGLLHAYMGVRILPDLAIGQDAILLGIGLLVVSTLLIPVGLASRLLHGRAPERVVTGITWIGLIAAGIASSLLVLTLLRDLALLPAMALLDYAPVLRLQHYSAWGAVWLALAFSAIGLFNARRGPRIVEVNIPLAGLPDALNGFRIAQISDIHVGPTIKRAFLERIVAKVNALDVQLVAITGDLVDGSVHELAGHTNVLQALRSTHGSFFVTGNHEYYSGVDDWVRELRRLGIRVLQNEHVVLRHQGASLVVAGVTDYSAHQFDQRQRSDPQAAIKGAPDAAAKLLLAHQPRSAAAAESAGFDLQLSGHTHGGQFFPWNYFVRMQQPYTAGLHRLNKLWIYTSRGTGYWGPPKRIGAPAEITLLRLVPASA